jgi:vancomycin resistance protein YoaR
MAALLRRIPKPVIWTLAGLLVLVAGTMVVDAVAFSGKIHTGLTVAGCDVSGLDRQAALATLAEHVVAAEDRSVSVLYEDMTWEVTPASLGLELDLEAAVSLALGATRNGNVFTDQAERLALYFRDRDIPLTGTVDQALLRALVAEVTDAIDRPAVDAGVLIQGAVVKAVPSQDGLTVDQTALREQVVRSLCLLETTRLAVPVLIDEPAIRADDCADAVALTQTMVSAPLTLASLDDSWTFTPAQVAHFIAFRAEVVDGVSTLVPFISADKMGATLRSISAQMSQTPIDASFQGDDTKAWVVPAVPGRKMKQEETVAAVSAAVLKQTDRTAEIVVELTEPEFTTQEAEAMGIKDLLSVRTTEFVGTKNRQHNVRITTEFIDQGGKCLVAPGEEFSFAETVGPRTTERGYKLAPGIQPLGDLDSELGGGICQVATTLFNSAFFAGLEVTERRNHTIYISHYPQGRDAAVTTDEVDLKFVNDTDHHIWIRGESDGIRTTFWIYGTSDGRKVTFRNSGIYDQGPAPNVWTSVDPSLPPGKSVVISPGQPYMKVKVTRWTTWPDGTVKEDVFLSVYPKRAKIVHVGPDS